MTRPILTRITVTSTEAGVTRRDSPEEVTAEAVEVTMMVLASAGREDSGLEEEPHEDAEVLGVAEVATLEVNMLFERLSEYYSIKSVLLF